MTGLQVKLFQGKKQKTYRMWVEKKQAKHDFSFHTKRAVLKKKELVAFKLFLGKIKNTGFIFFLLFGKNTFKFDLVGNPNLIPRKKTVPLLSQLLHRPFTTLTQM